MLQYYEDGTWVEVDAADNIVSRGGPSGSFGADTSIVSGFLRDLGGTLIDAIRKDYGLAPSVTQQQALDQAQASSLQASIARLIPIALLAVGGIFVYKALVR